jgi:hypothetical protein
MKRPAKKKPASAQSKVAAGRVPMELVDTLNNERLAAEAIDLAVIGASHIGSFDCSGISRLLDQHVDALRGISERLLGLHKEGKL